MIVQQHCWGFELSRRHTAGWVQSRPKRVGQDTISRLEKRSDMLLSTLRRYVEAMGGTLQLVAQFPNRPPVVIDHLAPTSIAPNEHRANPGA